MPALQACVGVVGGVRIGNADDIPGAGVARLAKDLEAGFIGGIVGPRELDAADGNRGRHEVAGGGGGARSGHNGGVGDSRRGVAGARNDLVDVVRIRPETGVGEAGRGSRWSYAEALGEGFRKGLDGGPGVGPDDFVLDGRPV